MKNCVDPCLRILFSFAIVSGVPGNAQESLQASSVPEQPERVAFVAAQSPTTCCDIFEINADGSGLRLITREHKQYWRWNSCPAWSPDGKKVAFISSDARVMRASHSGIFITTVAGGDTRLLLRDDTMCPQDPAWSPDGERLVFARGLKSRKTMGRLHMYIGPVCSGQQLFTVNLDGSGLKELTHSETNFNARPAWSPDGSTIAYMSGPSQDEARKADIFLMQVDGSNQRALTHGGAKEVNGDPAWSPEGNEIAFCSNRGGSYELYIMNRVGANLRQLTHGTPDGVRHPSWSPDGRQIVFATATGRAWPIRIVNANGTNLRVLTSVGWHPVFGKAPGP
jgi:TolB protein